MLSGLRAVKAASPACFLFGGKSFAENNYPIRIISGQLNFPFVVGLLGFFQIHAEPIIKPMMLLIVDNVRIEVHAAKITKHHESEI